MARLPTTSATASTQSPAPYKPLTTTHTVSFFLKQKPSGPPDDD